MRYSGLATLVLFALNGLTSAHPLEAGEEPQQLVQRNPDVSAVEAGGLTIKYGAEPKKNSKCPHTNNGPNRDYPEHTYTTGQLKAAFIASAKLQANGKQIGAGKYPHDYNNREALPFPCGRTKAEFPIQTNGKVYDGGDTANIPDRIIYEYKATKSDLTVKYCGTIRHGPAAFLKCTE